ncbi:hypothetical protein P3T36_003889 [Kitasatospora sp. MAP12-15]|uniref:hypothetical protein n=1 Tax=unclassified Kitasatospora TaxID=2633591 RepID=UPI00247430BF|nr:hypothetical protein [Kitasatospora sp. MAP12-44]MDH6108467.1 hypothetical protein [Kitasatospora sp. MAP12-44]
MAGDLREAAQRAVDYLVDGLAVNGLPALPGLEGGRVTLMPHGIHVEIGGASVRTVRAIADFLHEHAHCDGRVIPGEIVPSRLAELPTLRGELST